MQSQSKGIATCQNPSRFSIATSRAARRTALPLRKRELCVVCFQRGVRARLQEEIMSAADIYAHPIHLGRGATAEVEPEFTGDPSWYESYAARHADDGAEGRLVGMYRFIHHRGHGDRTPAALIRRSFYHGGIQAARMLIHAATVSDGYTALWERGRDVAREFGRLVPPTLSHWCPISRLRFSRGANKHFC